MNTPDEFQIHIEVTDDDHWVWNGTRTKLYGMLGSIVVHQHLAGYPIRMRNKCNHGFCVNPDHWDISRDQGFSSDNVPEEMWSRIKAEDTHWIWTGGKDSTKKYGMFRNELAHRVIAGVTLNQEMKDQCGNTLCVNPDHWSVHEKPIKVKPKRNDLDLPCQLHLRIQRCPPDDCWIWTGGTTHPEQRYVTQWRRSRQFVQERAVCLVRPYAVFQYKGKKTLVHRFLIGAKPHQRTKNHCGNTLCVNPDHWKISLGPMTEDKSFFDPETEIEDARRVVDGIGIARNLKLSDLITHPLLVDYSHDAIEQAWRDLCHA